MGYMNRIVLHHSGGSYKPNATDKTHYHEIIDGDCQTVEGFHAVEDNAPGRSLVSGGYAAHTLNLNSGAIGLCVACMHGAEWSKPYASNPPTSPQMDALLKRAAYWSVFYGIPPSRVNILTHAEVQITLGVAQRQKWDFDYDPYRKITGRDPIEIGDFIRSRVSAYRQDLLQSTAAVEQATKPFATRLPVLRRGSSGSSVVALQKLLHMAYTDGLFGPMTYSAVVAFQRNSSLLPDGIVGPMTWLALGQ